MKKSMTFGLVSMLAIGSFSSAFLNTAPIKVSAAEKDEDESEEITERVHVDSLTLEDAMMYGLNSDFSLMELEYTLQSLRISEDAADESYDDVEDNLDALQDQYKDLEQQLEKEKATSGDSATIDNFDKKINSLVNLLRGLNIEEIDAIINDSENAGDPAATLETLLVNIEDFLSEYKVLEQSTAEKLAAVREQIYSLTKTLESLDAQLDQLDLNITTTFNSRIQMREGIKLSIASTFFGLLMSQEQLDLMKSNLENQKAETNNAKIRYDLGLISEDEYEDATRDLTKLEEDIALAEKQLKNDKASFALTIGIAYNDDYQIVTPELGEVTLLKQQKPTEELIYNSYNMVNARTQLRIAEDNFDYVEDLDDPTDEQEDKAEIDIEVAKLNIESLEVELENAINAMFAQVESQYKAVKDAEKELTYAKEDIADTQLYYDLGLLSKKDYESSSLAVKQAELTYNSAKYQYYLLKQKVDSLGEGVILTN